MVTKNPYIILFISIVSVSFAAVLIISSDAPPLTIAFYRLLFTFLFILPIVLLTQSYRQELMGLSLRQKLWMIGVGVILAAHFAFWITSLTKTSVASSVILVTSHPFLVGVISHYYLKEKLHLFNIIGVVLSVLGVIVLISGNYILSISSFLGNVFAFSGGVAAGIYILGGRKMRERISTPCYALFVYGCACLVLFFLCLVYQSPLVNISIRDYSIFIMMALVSGILGHTLFNWSLKYIRASIASVSLLGEPLGSSILAFILPWIHQTPTYYTFVGGSFILLGIYLTSRDIKRRDTHLLYK